MGELNSNGASQCWGQSQTGAGPFDFPCSHHCDGLPFVGVHALDVHIVEPGNAVLLFLA